MFSFSTMAFIVFEKIVSMLCLVLKKFSKKSSVLLYILPQSSSTNISKIMSNVALALYRPSTTVSSVQNHSKSSTFPSHSFLAFSLYSLQSHLVSLVPDSALFAPSCSFSWVYLVSFQSPMLCGDMVGGMRATLV